METEVKNKIFSMSVDTLEALCFKYDNIENLDDLKSRSKIVTEISQVLEGMLPNDPSFLESKQLLDTVLI